MSKANDTHSCTCPSGDGSLRWPCPVHPALLPCPFCGASASGYEIEPHQHSAALLALVPNMPREHQGSYVIEGDCQCGSGLIGDNQTEVTARWNARAPQAEEAQAAPGAPDTNQLRAEIQEHASKGSRLVRTLFNEPAGTLSDVEVGDWILRAQQYLTLPSQAAPAAVNDKSIAAIATLENLGYTYHGGIYWKLPLGKAPNFKLLDSLHAYIASLEAQLSTQQTQPADALEPIRKALRNYHYALDTRQHGGAAGDAAIHSIEAALGMRWHQGQEANRRTAMGDRLIQYKKKES